MRTDGTQEMCEEVEWREEAEADRGTRETETEERHSGEALYGVRDFQHVDFNKRVGLLLERLFPGEVHRRSLKVDRIKSRGSGDALPISLAHVELMTGLINRMAFKDALTHRSPGLKIYRAAQVSQQIRKYTYRKRKAFELSRLPATERDKIKKTRQDKAKLLRQKRGDKRMKLAGDAVEAMEDVETVETPLARLLQRWHLHLRDDANKSRCQRMVIRVRGSKWVVPGFAVFMVRSLLDAVFNDNFARRHTPLLHFASVYGSMWSVIFFVGRAAECARAVGRLVPVAEHIGLHADDATKAQLGRMAGRLRTTMWTLLVIGVLHFVLGTGTILSAQKYSTVTLWFYGRRARWAAVANLLLCVEEVAVLAVAVVAYYSLLAVVFVVFSACTALFRAIASASLGAGARGSAALREVAALQTAVQGSALRMRLAYQTPLLHMLGAAFLVPLVVTVELIGTLNTATPAKFVNLAVRLVANIFVPLCVVGQMLETAGGLLEVSLYEGPWTEEDAASRLLRLLLMQAAAPDGGITALGLGRLNARSGLGLLRQWFNSINVLSKLTN